MAFCASCRSYLFTGETTGESSLYSPHKEYILCEPCWFNESDLIDEEGSNLPKEIERYEQNLKLGVK